MAMLTVAGLISGAAARRGLSMGEFAVQSASVAQLLLEVARSVAPDRYAQALEALERGGRTRLVIDSPVRGSVRVRLRVLRSPDDPDAEASGNFWLFSHEVPLSSLLASGLPDGGGFGAQETRSRWLLPGKENMPA